MDYIELIKNVLAYYGGGMFIYFGLHQVAAWLEEDYVPLGLTILQVWLVTKTYK